jgi:hypothetical protein
MFQEEDKKSSVTYRLDPLKCHELFESPLKFISFNLNFITVSKANMDIGMTLKSYLQ